ncbi:hypothetical protein EHS25_010310 [Saitozyma podzolica]|uniref:BAR domain-containing protein n=1 Tax=Saitozyma podzolica TaxID=1890683 RepID=A0A427YJ57_9TREE|nr:hypothetical protein EHS25_010310 [Saitozyma podzolica]
MQRKALKQLGKVTQWTNEKVFSGEKTQFSSEFSEFEKDVDVHRKGIERLHATSQPFFGQLTKAKQTADPYPPPGAGKDKISYTEALGLVMIDHGGDRRDAYGDGLTKYGRARCKLAIAQEEFANRLSEGYMGGMEQALETVNEYKAFRKKLDSRRLALDAAIAKLNGSKKDNRGLEEEVEVARARFEEIEEETAARMEVIQGNQEQQFSELADLLDAELEYFTKCRDILEELREQWPSGSVSISGRPRAKSNASARSNKSSRNTRPPESSEDERTPNRSRSQSNASASAGKGKDKRLTLPSFGSFGRKGGLSMGGMSMGMGKRKSGKFGGYDDGERAALQSDEEDDEYSYRSSSPRASGFSAAGRTRSTSTLSVSHISIGSDNTSTAPAPTRPSGMRRTYTSPSSLNARYVKALYPFAGEAADELALRPGQVVEIKHEVSDDWWVGESEGRSGMFPSAYVEEYVPTPQTAMPPRRTMPPGPGQAGQASHGGQSGSISHNPQPSRRDNVLAPPSPTLDYHLTSDSELSHGYDDADHYLTASLASEAQPAPQTRERSNTLGKKPPPPPPPSRRSHSSHNILSTSSSTALPPPIAPTRPRANTATRSFHLANPSPEAEGSPFAGSEDDLSELESDYQQHVPAAATANGRARAGTGGSHPGDRSGASGLASGLGAMHLGQTEVGAVGMCGTCGCDDFTQNVFKAKGMCSTCYHSH